MQALPGKAVKKVPGETAYCHHLPPRHPFRTPSKGVALSHHFSTPSEGVKQASSDMAFSLLFSVQTHRYIIPAKSCDHALSML